MENGEVGQGPEAVVETPAVTETPEGNSTDSQSEGHPAWAPIREAVGDFAFHKIQPNLAEFDRQAQARITELNSRWEPWKAFHEQGVTPDHVTQAFQILQQMESDPVALYQRLEAHLRETGKLPQSAQELVNHESQADPFEDEDPRDKALRELQTQNEQIQQFLFQQEQERQNAQAAAQADAALETELTSLRTARPQMTKQDEGEIIQRALLYAEAGQQRSLEQVAAEFDAIRNRILSTPRPNDLAPRIPGAGGTAPTGIPNQKAPAEYSRQESRDLMAEMIRKGQGS